MSMECVPDSTVQRLRHRYVASGKLPCIDHLIKRVAKLLFFLVKDSSRDSPRFSWFARATKIHPRLDNEHSGWVRFAGPSSETVTRFYVLPIRIRAHRVCRDHQYILSTVYPIATIRGIMNEVLDLCASERRNERTPNRIAVLRMSDRLNRF